MTNSAALTDLIYGLESQSDNIFAFLERETGEVVLLSSESLALANCDPEEIESQPDWRKEEAELARQIETDSYLSLPGRFDVHEWDIMRAFSEQVPSSKLRASLQNAVHGNHAFRRFKDQIATHNLWDPWNRFRANAFEEILRDWCEDNGITLVTGVPQIHNRQHVSS